MVRWWSAAVAVLLLVIGLGCAGLGDLDLEASLEGTPPPSADWVGRWEGPGMDLLISPEGHVRVDQRGESSVSLEAPAQSWTADGFDVGVFGITEHFTVDEPPYEHEGRWHMVVDEIPLVKVGDVAPMPSAADAPADALRRAAEEARRKADELERAAAELEQATQAEVGDAVEGEVEAPHEEPVDAE